MNFYTELVVVGQQDAIKIEECLCGDREFHDPITYTANFADGRFMDITLYPGDFFEDAVWMCDENKNPYVSCALFDKEDFFALASEDLYQCFFEDWELVCDGNTYKAIVISEGNWILDNGNTIEYLDDCRLLVTKPDGTKMKMY